MSKKVVTLLNKYGPMLSGELARKFEHEYGASNTAARQALSRAKKPVNKICTLSFDKNQKFFYLESQYMSNRYIERLMDAIKQSSQINWVYIISPLWSRQLSMRILIACLKEQILLMASQVKYYWICLCSYIIHRPANWRLERSFGKTITMKSRDMT